MSVCLCVCLCESVCVWRTLGSFVGLSAASALDAAVVAGAQRQVAPEAGHDQRQQGQAEPPLRRRLDAAGGAT